MKSTLITLRWLHFSLFGLALWFFGNLYEEIILMPNWLVAPIDVLTAYNRYYSVVIQYHYYVPVTQLSVLVLVWLSFRTGDPLRLRRAAVWGLLGTALTAWIVLSLNLDLFIGRLTLSVSEAHEKGLIWMAGNALRLICVGMSFLYTLRARDRLLRGSQQTE